ncbi:MULTISPECIES: PP2C family serine/threonine-protein phosphatase [unclassified Thioalkalivibrio]|uniref:PP2C family protein-serine/threonine phosphatase n=1 Tax=unclassified Thioalkalivibrio TaxID=2621013 RepID=UPI0003802856|nr:MULTISPECIES: protein phosphatase 2C domain-containing protein [unclassified Thioalkalivibrio]
METASASDIGARPEQQDAVTVRVSDDGRRALLAVADGMGGHAAGAWASHTAIATIEAHWEQCNGMPTRPARWLETVARAAHDALRAEITDDTAPPGSTLVVLFVDESGAWWVHCGDSRLLHFRGTRLIERTRDHSRVQELFEAGMIREQEMATHPDQNHLLAALGMPGGLRLDHGHAKRHPDSAFLLCTDGFWEQIEPAEMAGLLVSDDLSRGLDEAVRVAARRGGPRGDNIAVAAWRSSAPRGFDRLRHRGGSLVPSTLLGGIILLAVLAILFWPVGGG